MQKRFFSATGLGWCLWWSGHALALDINLASEADLDSLKGVGPATTQRLLAERGQGPFGNWADLMARVKGLRAPTARKLSDQGLTVNGVPFEGTPAVQPATPNPPPPGV
jgi:competence protein ComEA